MFFKRRDEQPENVETIVTALRAFADGVNPDSDATNLMRDGGYIIVAETTNIQSREREYFGMSITAKGRAILERSNMRP
jgi:hypothetical protein